MKTRPPAVAGTFYSMDGHQLAEEVGTRLHVPNPGPAPVALIAPHAGHMYSGSTAARAYARLRDHASHYRRVLLLGPAHRVPVRGMATVTVDGFETPLGTVAVDRPALEGWVRSGVLVEDDRAHRDEHSLEVHLPFLQTVLGDFLLLPVVVGAASRVEVADLIDSAIVDGDTLVVVSTDLSHFHDAETCRRRDALTAGKIETLDPAGLNGDEACGCHGVNGLIEIARRRGWTFERLEICHSGDRGGDRRRVVGYGAWAVNDR